MADDTGAGQGGSERRIGPYRLLRELGHGGMGTVFLAARADEQFHKHVALKVIRGADSAHVVRQFKRERQILAGLEHLNIARLLDGGSTDQGSPYLVMEHVDGQPLLEYCDSRSLSIQDRLKLFLAVCSAVQYAHRSLVVHRDIKPGNILVTEDGTPKLLDFGLAKLLNPELTGEGPTATGLAMTPAYASPEQVRGGPVTTATDVYSLGVVLYLLLTGHHPHGLASRSALQVLRAIAEHEPPPPSTAVGRMDELTLPEQATTLHVTPEAVSRTREGTPEKLKRRLLGDLDNIVLLALRKDPAQRYPSVDALAEDIRRYLEGRPVLARRPTVSYRAGKFVRRHTVAVAFSAALVLLLVAFAVAMAVQSARVARERDVARKERAAAQRVAAFLVDLFKVSDPSEARGNSITAREVLDKGAAKIETELKDQPEVRATLMDTLGNVYLSLGLYDRAALFLQQALATRQGFLGSRHPDVALSTANLAHVLRLKGDYVGAEALEREALALRRQLPSEEDVASSLNSLAAVLMEKGDYVQAEALHREGLALERKLFGSEHPRVAQALYNLAIDRSSQGDYAGAEPLHREALAIWRKAFGVEHPNVVKAMTNLAMVLASKGDNAAAEPLLREALATRRKLLGNEHPQVAISMNNLALVLAAKGDYAEAEALYREAIPLWRKLLGSQHRDVAFGLENLADLLCRQQKSASEADQLAREALAIFRKALPSGHPYTAEAESVLGGCLAASKRFAEAEPLLLGGHAVLKATDGDRTWEAQQAIERLVRLYEAWGKPVQAAEYRAQLRPTR